MLETFTNVGLLAKFIGLLFPLGHVTGRNCWIAECGKKYAV
jgi:hypothetical protein